MVSTRSQNYQDDRTAQPGRHASSRHQHAATVGNNLSLAAGSMHQAAAPVGSTQTSLLLQLPHDLLQLLLEAAVLPGTRGSPILSTNNCHALYATCRALRTALSTIISHHVQYSVNLECEYEVAKKLQCFPKLASLRRLELSRRWKEDLPDFIAAQPSLDRLTSVEELSFNNEALLLTADVASIVAACPSLKKLTLSQSAGEQFDGVSLALLRELRQLTDLSLEAQCGVMDFRVLLPLAQDQPGMDTLSVKVRMDARNGMPIIAAMSHLRSLTVALTEEQAASREFCTSLHALSSLTSLYLHGPAWWDAPDLQLPHAAAAAIAACTQLKRLDLQGFSVSGCADIALLASMPAVRYLKVGALQAESEVDLGRSTCCWEELVLLTSPSPEQLLRLPLHSLRALSLSKKGLRWASLGTPSAPLVAELADCIKTVAELTAPSIQTEQGHPSLKLKLGWDDRPSANCGTARMLAALMPWAHKLHYLRLDIWYVDEACVRQMAVSTPNLKRLVLEDCDVQAEAWSAMPTLEGLQDVKIVVVRMLGEEDRPIYNCINLPDVIKFVAATTRPVRILVDDAVVTAGTVDGCMELRIGNCMVDAHVVRSIVVALPQLRRLHLSSCGIPCEAWVALQSLSLLDHLCISNETSWNGGNGVRHHSVVPQDLVAYAITVARRVQVSICEGALFPEALEACVDTVRQFTAAGGQAAHICSMAGAE